MMGIKQEGLERNKPLLKERLSDEEIGNLLSAFGNHEAKALTLIAMKVDEVYSRGDLTRTLINLQGDKVLWKFSGNTLFGYCEWSLSSIGLVTKEIINKDLNTYGFSKTRYGEEIGDAFCGHLLSISESYPAFPLTKLFGQTSSRAKTREVKISIGVSEYQSRAPITRLRIFRALLSDDLPKRLIDLAKKTEIHESILNVHILELSRLGVITYDSRGSDKPFVYYRVYPDRINEDPYKTEIKPKRTDSLRRRIYNYVKSRKDWLTVKEIVDYLVNSYSDDYIRGINLTHGVNHTLSFFKKLGYIEILKWRKSEPSKISLTDKQKQFIEELLNLIEGIQRQNTEFLQEGRKRAHEILVNPKRVSNLFQKAREASSHTKGKSQIDISSSIYSIILSQNIINSTQIRDLLEIKYGIRLRKESLLRYINKLRRDRKINIIRKTATNYWSVIDKQ